MGIGSYNNGKFTLYLSIRYNVNNKALSAWQNAFKDASQKLFNATGMQIGTLRYKVNDLSANADADAYLLNAKPANHAAAAAIDKLKLPGYHMTLFSDDDPYTIVHEMGHYALGLYDEWQTRDPNTGVWVAARCTGDPNVGACIMEFNYTHANNVTKFCSGANHTAENCQHYKNKVSCQDYINAKFGVVPQQVFQVPKWVVWP
jgi:hypothetical protein